MYSLTLGKVSDAIAHFIGLLNSSIEEARQKQAFESFKAHHAKDPQLEDKDAPVIKVDASHDLENFDPNVPYLGPAPVLEPWSHWTHVELNPPHIPIPVVIASPSVIRRSPGLRRPLRRSLLAETIGCIVVGSPCRPSKPAASSSVMPGRTCWTSW